MPRDRARAATALELGMPRMSRRAPSRSRAAMRRVANAAVVPAPSPTTIPERTSSTARSAAIRLNASLASARVVRVVRVLRGARRRLRPPAPRSSGPLAPFRRPLARAGSAG